MPTEAERWREPLTTLKRATLVLHPVAATTCRPLAPACSPNNARYGAANPNRDRGAQTLISGRPSATEGVAAPGKQRLGVVPGAERSASTHNIETGCKRLQGQLRRGHHVPLPWIAGGLPAAGPAIPPNQA